MAVTRTPANTGQVENGRIVRDVLNDLAQLEPEKKALTLLTTEASDDIRMVDAPVFRHWEHAPLRRTLVVNNGGGYSDSDDGPWTVTDSSGVYENGVFRNMRSGEQVRITTVTSATVVGSTAAGSIVRGAAGTVAAAINDGDVFLRIGTAKSEGGSVGSALTQQYSEHTGNIQKFENPWGVTDIMDATKTETGSDYMNQKRHALFEHGVDIELALWWGEAGIDNPTSAEPTYYTRGFFNIPGIQEFDVSGSLNEDEFVTDIAPLIFRYSSSNRMLLFGGAIAMAAFARWGRERIQTNPGLSKTLGYSVSTYVTPFGSIDLIYHKLFEGEYGDVPDNWPRMAALVDPANIRLARLKPSRVWENVQDNDEYIRKGAAVSYVGLDYRLAQTHAVIRGIY